MEEMDIPVPTGILVYQEKEDQKGQKESKVPQDGKEQLDFEEAMGLKGQGVEKEKMVSCWGKIRSKGEEVPKVTLVCLGYREKRVYKEM